MAEYIGIKGSTIQSLSSDPPAPIEGQVWYNTTSTVLKGYKLTFGTGTWAAGDTANETRAAGAGFGTATAAVQATGTQNPGGNITNAETYNGSTWSEVNNINTAGDSIAACGIVTAGIINSRSPGSLLTESWDGTCWSEVNDQNDSSRGKRADAGTQAGAVCMGGEAHPAVMNETETWDGTCWTPVAGVLNNGRSVNYGGAGTSTAAIVSGGAPPSNSPVYGYTEIWDGTSWTEVADMNNPIVYGGAAGTTTDSVYAGGIGPPGNVGQNNAESWNGTSWSTATVLGTAVTAVSSAGNGTAGLILSGYLVPWATTGISQEWTVPSGNETKTFTAS